MPKILSYITYLLKRSLCILTINSNNICILPYKKINNIFLQKIIVHILRKITHKVVLSNYLNGQEEFVNILLNSKLKIVNNTKMYKYLLFDIIKYISNMQNKNIAEQEIHILICNTSTENIESIIHIIKQVKQVNIITNNIIYFNRLSEYFEKELGIAITVTNNKRKSLSKAKIILNIDFNDEMLNSFYINENAIIVQPNKEIRIKSKLFNGVNVCDYLIESSRFKSEIYSRFDNKLLYESILYNKNFEEVRNIFNNDNLNIINLVGINGIIDVREYTNILLKNKKSIDKTV